jgi:oligoribonuclease (3'-5' exoribonuclease)
MMERWLPESEAAWKAAQIQQSNYNHRAMNDVESSIKSMQWIRLHLLVQPASSDHQHPA